MPTLAYYSSPEISFLSHNEKSIFMNAKRIHAPQKKYEILKQNNRNLFPILGIFYYLILNILFTSCAHAVSSERKAYITANDHGWIELTVIDKGIPAKELKEGETPGEPEPPTCHISVQLNNEFFLSETIHPAGKQPAYSVHTGFRFIAPEGEYLLALQYSGCHGKPIISQEKNIAITESHVTPLQFDGEALSAKQSVPDGEITLEEIDDRLRKIEEAVGISAK